MTVRSRLPRGAAAFVDAAADLLLGARCLGCDRPGLTICDRCTAMLNARSCAINRPTPCPVGYPLTVSAGPYDLLARRLIVAHKERQALLLTPILARRLALAIVGLLAYLRRPPEPLAEEAGYALVAMPSVPAAIRARGYDATAALARSACRMIGSPSISIARHLLVPTRRLDDQSDLNAHDRQANLRGGLRAEPGRWPTGRAAVIIDDLVTTGASLTEASRALRAAGIPVLGAATVAATKRQSPPSRVGVGFNERGA